MKNYFKCITITVIASATTPLFAQDHRNVVTNPTKPDVTEFWDPEVKVISPGIVPSDAIVLFDGKNLDNWETVKDGSLAKWKVEDGKMTVVKGAGNISTKQKFTDYQLHVEWQSPIEDEKLKSQGKGYQTRINSILRREMLKSIKDRGNFA
jgi:hypothetical protein